MHTLVKLDRGLLEMKLVGMDDWPLNRSKWRAAIAPAIALLRSLGGGCTFVHHRPSDLLP